MKRTNLFMCTLIFFAINSCFLSACKKDSQQQDQPQNWTCTILVIDLYHNPNASSDTTKSVTHFTNLTSAEAKAACVAGSDTSFSPNGNILTQTFLTPN